MGRGATTGPEIANLGRCMYCDRIATTLQQPRVMCYLLYTRGKRKSSPWLKVARCVIFILPAHIYQYHYTPQQKGSKPLFIALSSRRTEVVTTPKRVLRLTRLSLRSGAGVTAHTKMLARKRLPLHASVLSCFLANSACTPLQQVNREHVVQCCCIREQLGIHAGCSCLLSTYSANKEEEIQSCSPCFQGKQKAQQCYLLLAGTKGNNNNNNNNNNRFAEQETGVCLHQRHTHYCTPGHSNPGLP